VSYLWAFFCFDRTDTSNSRDQRAKNRQASAWKKAKEEWLSCNYVYILGRQRARAPLDSFQLKELNCAWTAEEEFEVNWFKKNPLSKFY